MTILVTNNAYGLLASAITNVSASIAVQSGQGARFPSPGVGEAAFITLIAPATGSMEIVKYTSRTGDTFTGLTRGTDGTVAQAFSAGDALELRVVAANYTIDGIAPNQTSANGKFLKSVSGAAQWAQAIASDISGLGTLATQNGTFSGTHSGASSGTNTGDQTITLTGDVTGSGTGSFPATIAANAVTTAKLAQMASGLFLGRVSAGTGNVETVTPAQAKTLLGITGSDITGLAPIATTGSANDLNSGTVPTARFPAFVGDVTTTAGTVSSTIANNAVTLAKMAQVTAPVVLGRTTAGAGNVEAMTPTQVKALLAIAQADVAGLTNTSDVVFNSLTTVQDVSAYNTAASNRAQAKSFVPYQYIATVSGAITIDFNNSQSQILTINAASSVAAINNVPVGSILRVVFVTGGNNPSSWPASVKWTGTTPNLTAGALDRAIVVFENDGTYLLASYGTY